MGQRMANTCRSK